MGKRLRKYSIVYVLFFLFCCSFQTVIGGEAKDTLFTVQTEQVVDTSAKKLRPVEPRVFMPDPEKAVWYALICPGLGQIYNRSYWKVPILYGGIATLSYLIIWNGRMYNDYNNAYHDIMDNDPNTNSYVPIFYNMPGADLSWKQTTLKNKRDRYRRYRDLSILGMAALYVMSVVDSFVDAQLYDFSISEDLSLRIEPVINGPFYFQGAPNATLLGFRCSINF